MIRRQIKLVREGEYVAEVEVELIEEGEGWEPYLSLEDAEKLDVARKALQTGEIERRARAAVAGEPGVSWEETRAAIERCLADK